MLAADAIFVPDTKASTAGIHVAKVLQQLGIADEVDGSAQNLSERRDRDAPSGGVRRRQADRLHAIDRNHQHPGVMLSGSLPPGCELATMYTAAVAAEAANAGPAQSLIDLLTNADQRELRERAGFLSVRK